MSGTVVANNYTDIKNSKFVNNVCISINRVFIKIPETPEICGGLYKCDEFYRLSFNVYNLNKIINISKK